MGISLFPSSSLSISDVRTANSTLTLRQTITSSQAVTIPAGVTRVFAIVIGGGGGGASGALNINGGNGHGGGGGGVSYGWTVPSKYAFIGAGGNGGAGGTNAGNAGTQGSASVFGSIVAGGGGRGIGGATQSTLVDFVNVSTSPYFMSVSGAQSGATSGAIPGQVLIGNGAVGGGMSSGTNISGAGAAITNDVTTTSIRQYTYGWGEVTILPGSPNIAASAPSAAYYGNSSGANGTAVSSANGRAGGASTYASGGGAGGNVNLGGGISGATNTGGGGGSNGNLGGGTSNGAGGSGIVIIRYPDSFPLATATTGSPTVTNPTGYRVYTFTASGSITF